MSAERTVEPVKILDWYDGLVSGVVRVSWVEGRFLAALLCWSMDRRLRVYALRRLGELDLRELEQSDWLRLTTTIERIFLVDGASVSLICVDEQNGIVVAEEDVPASEVEGQLALDVEQALAPQQATWLSRLGIDGGAAEP